MAERAAVRVLLIEDDDEDAFIFLRHLSRMTQHRADAERAAGEGEAEERLAAEDFDLVFLDLNLSGRSGMDLLRRFAEDGMAVPVIVVTGSGNEMKAVEAMKSGAYDYLVKDSLSGDLLDRTVRHARERWRLEEERAQMVQKLAQLSITDELTGIANRRHLLQKLDEEVTRSDRTGHLFAVLMIDLDHFKEINDLYGHQVGDEVLKRLAVVLHQTVRDSDVVSRYGGEEFCIVLPETHGEGARQVAEKLLEFVRALSFPVPTISIGVAFWEPDSSTDDIIRRADEALYAAKRAGRDRYVVYSHNMSQGLAQAD